MSQHSRNQSFLNVKKLLKFLFPMLLGAALGAGGYFSWVTYMPDADAVDSAIKAGPSVLETLPYGMHVAKTTFANRPVFCIEQADRKTEVQQVCKVSPGFYATFINELLHSVEWDITAGARFQNEWRKAGLSTNQTGVEFMNVVHRLGATKIRFERDTDSEKILTFDVGDMSYRLWLQTGDAKAKALATRTKAAKDDADTEQAAKLDLGIGANFVVTKLATILSFD